MPEGAQQRLRPPLQKGEDPRRVLPNHRERGSAAYRYTQEDVARAAGAPLSAVRRARSRGELRFDRLETVFAWVAREKARRQELPRG